MTFIDIFKNSFLELADFGNISWISITQTMVVAFIVAGFIFFIYKRCYRGVVYSHNFNITIALMTVITAMIITTISSNIVLSLGMVGALSIVRFRSAIKDPMDLMFLFWAVAEGIAVGAGIYPVIVVGTIIIGIAFILFTRFKARKLIYLLVINYQDAAYPEIQRVISQLKHTVRSKMTKKGNTELTVELHLKDDNSYFVNILSEIPDVNNVSLVSFNGDFAQ